MKTSTSTATLTIPKIDQDPEIAGPIAKAAELVKGLAARREKLADTERELRLARANNAAVSTDTLAVAIIAGECEGAIDVTPLADQAARLRSEIAGYEAAVRKFNADVLWPARARVARRLAAEFFPVWKEQVRAAVRDLVRWHREAARLAAVWTQMTADGLAVGPIRSPLGGCDFAGDDFHAEAIKRIAADLVEAGYADPGEAMIAR